MLKRYAKYVLLNVFGMLGLSFYILADTYFISAGLGANGLTALNLAIPIYSFIHGSGLMIGMGGGTTYTIQKSQQEHDQANKTLTTSLVIGSFFACIFILLGLFYVDFLVELLGANRDVYEMTRTYLQVILLFSPAFLLNNIMLCFIRNDGNPALAMTAMLTGSISNIILDWVFIFPCRMGIFGAVFATGLAPIISLSVLSIHLIQKKNQFHLSSNALAFKRIMRILLSGIPSLITEVSSGIVMIVFNMLILQLTGNIGVAAYGVIANLSLVVMAIYTGIAQGIQPLLCESYGHQQTKEIKSYLKLGLFTCMLVALIIYMTIYLEANSIASIFNSEGNKTLQSIATEGMRIYFLACPFAGINTLLAIYFTSTERPLPAQIISITRGFVLILPLAFILSSAFQLFGIWLTFPLTEGIVALFTFTIFIFHRKKTSF